VPDIFELLVSVRFDEPAVAVTVTEEASLACQLSVTLWPSLIELALTEKISVGCGLGVGGGGCGGGFDVVPEVPFEQEHSTNSAIEASPTATQRNLIFLIRCMRTAEYRFQRATFLMPTGLWIVAFS
jgi:hypothetical protein